MAPIESAIEQEQIADSILGDDSNIIASFPSSSGLLDMGESEDAEAPELRTEEQTALEREPEELAQLSEYVQQQQQQSQAVQPQPEMTPADVHQGLQQIDSLIEQLQLNDQTEATQLAYALGMDPSAGNIQAFDQTLTRAVVSALQIYDSGQALGQIPQAAAQAFTYDFLRAQGADPRSVSVDAQALSTAVLGGMLNFMEAVKTYGMNANLDQLNSPQGAEWFAGNLLKAFGYLGPVNREYALKLADAGGRYLMNIFQKLEQVEPPRSSRSAGRSRRTHAEFQGDLQEGLQMYRQEHGRL